MQTEEDIERAGLWLSPTTRVLRTLRLPKSWEVWVDRRRVVHDDVRDQRRQWIVEALDLALILALLPISLAAAASHGPSNPQAYLWLASAPTVGISWYFAIKGKARAVLLVTLPLILAESTLLTLGRGELHTAFTATLSLAFVIVVAALAESIRTTLMYGFLSMACAMYVVAVDMGQSFQLILHVFFTLWLVIVVALIGSWVNLTMYRRAAVELARNQQLSAELEERVRDRTRQLKELSERDALTGLANRRVFMEHLRRCREDGREASMLMIDVDHFKAINDTYGHNAGDEALRRLAAELGRHVRGSDVIARLGGEEFAVLLPGKDVTVAALVAERIRDGVASMDWDDVQVPNDQVTVSVGISHRQFHDDDAVNALMREADESLYTAKRTGRNRVCVHARLEDVPLQKSYKDLQDTVS